GGADGRRKEPAPQEKGLEAIAAPRAIPPITAPGTHQPPRQLASALLGTATAAVSPITAADTAAISFTFMSLPSFVVRLHMKPSDTKTNCHTAKFRRSAINV